MASLLQLYSLFSALLLLLLLLPNPSIAASSTPPSKTSLSDAELVLAKIKPSLQGKAENQLLSSWDSSNPLCEWHGLTWVFSDGSPLLCNDFSSPHRSNLSLFKDPLLQLLSLQLPDANLTGELPRDIADLSSLKNLYLGFNSLHGNIPLEIGYSPSLSDLDFTHNLLIGALPTSIWNLCDNRLAALRFRGNNLSGTIPEPALPDFSCKDLRVLDLGDNLFGGSFPEFITGFDGLRELDLGNNLMSGVIPESLNGLRLERLNLSHNNFSGQLPIFKDMKNVVGEEVWVELRRHCGDGDWADDWSCGFGFCVDWVCARKEKEGRGDNESKVDEGDIEENVDGGGGEGKLVLFQGAEHLTLEDVLNATGQVMEKTSYGTIYKAKLADGGNIALRLLREGSCKDRASCLPVIRQLGRVRHENLVPLRAFYHGQRGEKLLIYDYFPHKSLFDLLHDTRVGKPVLNWARRHKIALGVARGLAHLHTGLETPITHGNVRSKNVIVDEFFVARLTEFGIDKMMVPAVTDEMITLAKTDGYKAPDLQKMKKCNSRTDVYAFGILLLEILLGKKPGKDGRSGEYVDLPSLVKVAVLEETTMEVFDVALLKGIRSPMEEGLVQALKLAMGCCAPVASVRPDMDEVVKQLEENRPRNRSALYSPAETRSEIVLSIRVARLLSTPLVLVNEIYCDVGDELNISGGEENLQCLRDEETN
ncbi:hypothetical protein Scep_029297 [Stephania cephalantha]|uniref:Protein kinase domain-containing protein n=1 Tax=Stephania cephalantha TaxID=152367 RepID=A0AAP0DXG0_9MAGN